MIYPSDLQHLCASWSERVANHSYPPDYRDAISECLYDVSNLVDKAITDELTEQDAMEYILSKEADNYISSMEVYEQAEA